MADQPTQKGQRRASGAAASTDSKATVETVEKQETAEQEAVDSSREAKIAAGADAGEDPTVTDAGNGTGGTDGTSEQTAVESNQEAAIAGAEGTDAQRMGIAGASPTATAPLRDQAISNSTRNPSPVSSVTGRPLITGPDYTTANTNSMRSSASPIDHPGVRTRDEHNPNRIALARGMTSIPGEGHLSLVGEDGAALTFAAVFPDYTPGDASAVSAVRVYERFTQPNVKAKNFSTRLFFSAGQPVPVATVEKLRMALLEEAAAAASTVPPVSP